MSVLLRVEELPLTDWGAASRLLLKAPPERVDSAARESEAMAPAPSAMRFWEASGSVVCCDFCVSRLVYARIS